jgi:hypothetical protein
MPIIGKRSKSGTLCISLDPTMKSVGFVEKAKANWVFGTPTTPVWYPVLQASER